jgi:hypothetical protein
MSNFLASLMGVLIAFVILLSIALLHRKDQ